MATMTKHTAAAETQGGCLLLFREFSFGRDDADLLELWQHRDGSRVRIRIRSNSFKFQCSAYAERWSDGRWEPAWEIMPQAMTTPAGLSTTIGAGPESFREDRVTLLYAVGLILHV